ncbi:MAG: PilN domain-containing protein [Gammaproteobacteria bacterium]|nr:PilN domain-containing protein [Gammaproteobacteria bacterium]
MIKQQINLFQPIFRKERKLLSFHALLQACGAVILLLLGLYGWGWQQTQYLQSDFISLQKQSERQITQLSAIGIKPLDGKPKVSLQKKLAQLEQQLLTERKTVTQLTQARNSYSRGVSGYLESFSRQLPKGVWLTGFSVQAGGQNLIIRGGALKPALVPLFLEQLSAEATLSGTHFGLLQIERQKSNEKYIHFTVYTGTDAPEEAKQ